MKYKVLEQHPIDERLFKMEDENGDCFWIDWYTDGKVEPPKKVSGTAESWRAWLGSYVGKVMEIEKITPHTYFTSGDITIIDPN